MHSLQSIELYDGLRIRALLRDPLVRPFTHVEFWRFISLIGKQIVNALHSPTSAFLIGKDLKELLVSHSTVTQLDNCQPIFVSFKNEPHIIWRKLDDTKSYKNKKGLLYLTESPAETKKNSSNEIAKAFETISSSWMIPWQKNRDNCQARADIACKLLMSMGFSSNKIGKQWCFGGPLINDWIFHVAATVEDEKGIIWVLDPTVAREPIQANKWLALINNKLLNNNEITPRDIPLRISTNSQYVMHSRHDQNFAFYNSKIENEFQEMADAYFDSLSNDMMHLCFESYSILKELFEDYFPPEVGIHSLEMKDHLLCIKKLELFQEKALFLLTPKDVEALILKEIKNMQDFIKIVKNYLNSAQSVLPSACFNELQEAFMQKIT